MTVPSDLERDGFTHITLPTQNVETLTGPSTKLGLRALPSRLIGQSRAKRKPTVYETGYKAGYEAANTLIRDVIFDDRMRGNEIMGVYYALEADVFSSEFVVSEVIRALRRLKESREYETLLRLVLASVDITHRDSDVSIQQ